MHRDPIGEVKTMSVKRDGVGDWYIMLMVELPEVLLKAPGSAVGIDLGLTKLVQASNGEFVQAQKFYQKSEGKLKRAQRALSRKVDGSKSREKARIIVARIHRKIQRQREDFLHKVSKELVSRADLLCVRGPRRSEHDGEPQSSKVDSQCFLGKTLPIRLLQGFERR